jgi:hypothetical protein
LDEVENPSILKTGQLDPNTVSDQPPAAAPYRASDLVLWHVSDTGDVRFSNRPFGVKHFQTIHHCSVDVAHGLALLFGIGTKALPPWDSRTRRNNLFGGLAVN